MIKLANRIESLKQQEEEGENGPGDADVPASALETTGESLAARDFSGGVANTDPQAEGTGNGKKNLSRLARGAIFKEIVLAKVREEKEAKKQAEMEEAAKAGHK